MTNPPLILTLTGVSLKDFRPPEDIADERLREAAVEAPTVAIATGEALPTEFVGVEHWPMTTDIRCHSCGFTFSCPPVSIPTSMTESAAEGAAPVRFRVRGCYCSFGCAELAIVESPLSHSEKARQQNLLRWLCYVMYGVRPAKIEPALPRTALRQYGGPLSDDEYLSKNAALSPVKQRQIQWWPASEPGGTRSGAVLIEDPATAGPTLVPPATTADLPPAAAEPTVTAAEPATAEPIEGLDELMAILGF